MIRVATYPASVSFDDILTGGFLAQQEFVFSIFDEYETLWAETLKSADLDGVIVKTPYYSITTFDSSTTDAKEVVRRIENIEFGIMVCVVSRDDFSQILRVKHTEIARKIFKVIDVEDFNGVWALRFSGEEIAVSIMQDCIIKENEAFKILLQVVNPSIVEANEYGLDGRDLDMFLRVKCKLWIP